ncbi:MAG: NAD(P)-dependent oxidoreductase [Sphingobium sp. 66-54]|mgnify:CR=1 FL=1|nr:MAG: NAD(P)-dependent oxidoreductase [Sphingobium sp. 66-54]
MTNRLAGKHCLITGAAQGIGFAIARAFLREGAHVIATDLQGDGLAERFAGLEHVTCSALDATDSSAAEALAQANPQVNVLVNCAGIVLSGTLLDAAPDALARSLKVNVGSVETMIRAFLPAMLAGGGGSIVNIASVVSSVMAAPNRFAYGTSKAAVIGLTMSVARDFITQGIRCNAISPGTVDSPSLAERLRATGDEAAARAAFIARQPMGRIGTPGEIAEVAVLLASDEARFMTGANIVIDGGMSL